MAARITPFTFESPIFAGQAAQVTCLVSEGDPPLEISWSFNEKDDLQSMKVTTMKIGYKASMLFIDSANYRHRGNYTCTAKNPAGKTEFTTFLNIHGQTTNRE